MRSIILNFTRCTALRPIGLAAALLAPAAHADLAPPASGSHPILEVKEPSQDGGRVEEGMPVRVYFKIANRGSADLEIQQVKPDCGCSVAHWEKLIKPGGTGTIEVEVHTDYFRGSITKHLTVLSNDPLQPELRLAVTAQITPLVEITPGTAALLGVDDAPATQEFTLQRTGGSAMKIVEVIPNAPYLQTEVTPLPGQGHYRLKLTATMDTPPGRNVVPVVVKTDLPKSNMLTLVVTVDRGIVTVPPMVFFGIVPKQLKTPTSAAVTVSRRSGSFHVKELSVDDPKLEAKLEPLRDGAEYRITVTYRGGWEEGFARKTLTLTTDDPNQPVLKIPVQAVVQVDGSPLPQVTVQ
jgi:uncharacterized protein DUF1573